MNYYKIDGNIKFISNVIKIFIISYSELRSEVFTVLLYKTVFNHFTFRTSINSFYKVDIILSDEFNLMKKPHKCC